MLLINVMYFISPLASTIASHYQLNVKFQEFIIFQLLVKVSDENLVIFTLCLLGVYTRNRNFRIFRSTKIGKKSHLLLSNQNTFKVWFVRPGCEWNQ